jgi:ABC-type branched-subunit amino acid transport system substrate-binding protein
MEAWAKQLNARGGLFGRPVEIRRCDFKLDPQAATACVQGAIADPDVLAFAGGSSSLQPVVMAPAAEAAGMLILPGSAVTPTFGSMPTGFVAMAGIGVLLQAIPRYLVEKGGLTKVASIRADLEATAPNAQQVKASVEAAGGQFVADVKVPLTATDMLPAVTEAAAAGAQAIVASLAIGGTIGVVNAIRDGGFAGKIAIVTGPTNVLDPALSAAVKDAGVDWYFGSETDAFAESGETHADYVAAMTLNGSADQIPFAHCWLSYQAGLAMEAIIKAAGPDLTRKSLLDTAMTGTFDVKGFPVPLHRGIVAATPAYATNKAFIYKFPNDVYTTA